MAWRVWQALLGGTGLGHCGDHDSHVDDWWGWRFFSRQAGAARDASAEVRRVLGHVFSCGRIFRRVSAARLFAVYAGIGNWILAGGSGAFYGFRVYAFGKSGGNLDWVAGGGGHRDFLLPDAAPHR